MSGPLHGMYILIWVRYIKNIYTQYFVVCLRSVTIGTSRQIQLACHIRVDLQNIGKARIASPDGARGSRSRGGINCGCTCHETERVRKGLNAAG